MSEDQEEEPDFMAYQIDEEMRKKRVFPSQVEDIEAEKDLGPAMCVTPFAVAPTQNTQEEDIAEEKEFEKVTGFSWKGYHRDVHMTGKVLSALVRAMDVYPSLRLGQLLYAALENSRPPTTSPEEAITRLETFHQFLFYIYDEDLIRALDKFVENKKKGKF